MPGRQDHILRTGSGKLTQLQRNRVGNGTFAHWLDDTGGTQNRQPSHNTQLGIKRARSNLCSARNGNHHIHTAAVPQRRTHSTHLLFNHGPGHMVDCRCNDRLVQPRLRHPAYAFAAVNKNPACVRRRTAAQTSMPSVTSLSSPASLVTAQRAAAPSSNTIASTRDAVTVTPLGVVSVTAAPTWPVSSSRAAPAAAKAAQVPVV